MAITELVERVAQQAALVDLSEDYIDAVDNLLQELVEREGEAESTAERLLDIACVCIAHAERIKSGNLSGADGAGEGNPEHGAVQGCTDQGCTACSDAAVLD